MADLVNNQTHIVVVTGVIEKNGKFLIAQRSFDESHMPGWWSIPGGKVERTNSEVRGILEATLKRELMEEVGVEIEDSPKLISDSTFLRSTGDHVIWLVFHCFWKSGEAKALDECIDVAWVGSRELQGYKVSKEIENLISLCSSQSRGH
jgi:8-oxo-dGTP pyrophosphatase MutT (NUDIX family)